MNMMPRIKRARQKPKMFLLSELGFQFPHANLKSMTFDKFFVLITLSWFCFLPNIKSIAATILVEGKCTVPEINSSYNHCLALNDGNSITILTGRSQSLQYKVALSNVILSGRLTTEFEKNSPLLESNILKSLAFIITIIYILFS